MKTSIILIALFWLASMLGGCVTIQQQPVTFSAETTLSLAGPRCAGPGSCRCRPLDSNEDQLEDQIPAGHKRFEFRLPRSTSAIWVDIEGRGHFYKPPHKVEPACFYLDLPTGETGIRVHGENRDQEVGLQVGLTINEYSAKDGPNWYPTLALVCGGMNRCTPQGLGAWVNFQRNLPKGILNRCGSVKIQGVQVGGIKEQKGDAEYQQLTVKFGMKIYQLVPYQRPDAPQCQVPAQSQQ